MVGKEKQEALHKKMEALGIKEEDLVEKFILGSGSGGQKINKTASCVYLKHLPSGIEAKCQQDRSREMNRYLARRTLTEEIERRLLKEESKQAQEAAKIRHQKKRRSRRQKAKLIEGKREVSAKKALRKAPSLNNDEK